MTQPRVRIAGTEPCQDCGSPDTIDGWWCESCHDRAALRDMERLVRSYGGSPLTFLQAVTQMAHEDDDGVAEP
jgi:hypothetical protein